jgi:hypothetical protein
MGVDAVVAAGPWLRLLGLTLLPLERAPAALLIPRCASVHTFGMRFPIDVVFLDGAGVELGRERRVMPRRLVRRRGAAAVLELPRMSEGA